MTSPVHIIGGGLAGCEAAWQLAAQGVAVVLHEMRPMRMTAAHKTEALAELVCSNSFRSDDREHNAVGDNPFSSPGRASEPAPIRLGPGKKITGFSDAPSSPQAA